jgi:SPP1 gp7 family putative phage head morphogenesis protein
MGDTLPRRTLLSQLSKLQIFKPLINALGSPEKKQILTQELDIAAGFEVPLENPNELLRDKGQYVTLFDKMALDDVIVSTLEAHKRITLSVPYSIVPASEDPKDLEKADFVRKVIEDLQPSMTDTFDNFMDSRMYGYKVGEKVWTARDGKWVWQKIKHSHSYHFDFGYEPTGALDKLVVGRKSGTETVITGKPNIFKKFIISVYPYPIDGNWYGKSDLTEIYLLWYQKYNIRRWQAMYLQGYGMPIPIAKYDSDAMKDSELDTLQDMLRNWQDNMYLTIPGIRNQDGDLKTKYEIEFETVYDGSGNTPYDDTLSNYDAAMRRRLLMPDKMGFTDSDGGSYNMAETQLDVYKMTIRDSHTRLEELINPHIEELCDYNFPPSEQYPRLEFAEIGKPLEKEMLQMLIEKGIVDARENWIRGKLDIPELTEEEKEALEQEDEEEEELTPAPEPKANTPGTADGVENPQKDDEQDTTEYKRATPFFDVEGVRGSFDNSEKQFIPAYNEVYLEAANKLVKLAEKKGAFEEGGLKEVDKLKVKKTDLLKLVTSLYYSMYVKGNVDAFNEIRARIPASAKAKLEEFKTATSIPDEWLDRAFIDKVLEDADMEGLSRVDLESMRQLRDQAFFVTGDLEQRMVRNVFFAVKEGLNAGENPKVIRDRVEASLAADRKQYATTIVRTNSADAYNTGRMNLFTSDEVRPLVEAYMYSAILDNVTTEFCQSHNEQVIKADDPGLGIITPPNHYNCRSILTAILVGENNDKDSPYYNYTEKSDIWGTDVPATERLPAKGFGGVS